MEESFDVQFEDTERVDQRTFNASFILSNNSTRYPCTVRLYEDISLAKAVYNISKSVQHSSVARAKLIEIPSLVEGTLVKPPTKIVFQPFYLCTFNTWAGLTHLNDDIKKVFRSIAALIELFHGKNHYRIGNLEESIRIDKNYNVQIVPDSKTSGKMERGRKDISNFIRLVVRVFKSISNFAVGYRYFIRLRNHFRYRKDSGSKGWLRSYSYFILNNPLFFDVGDRYKCAYKLKIIRDMKAPKFDKAMFPKPSKRLANWWKTLFTDPGLERIYKSKEGKLKTEGAILLFYQHCQSHLVDINMGIIEIQERLDNMFPNAIFCLFYYFVKRMESDNEFLTHVGNRYDVLGHYKGVHLSYHHLK